VPRVVQAPTPADPITSPYQIFIPDFHVLMPEDRQQRMSRRMREWNDRQEKAMARRFSRMRQDAMERRIREQICAIVRERAEAEVC
jgi:hypothetical protein